MTISKRPTRRELLLEGVLVTTANHYARLHGIPTGTVHVFVNGVEIQTVDRAGKEIPEDD